MLDKPGRTKIVELATADSRICACITGAFTRGVGQRAEVREEQSALGEVGTQRAQEVHYARRDVFGCGRVWREGEVVVYRAYGGKFNDGWEGWWVPDAASEIEERRDERVRDPRVLYAVVRVDVDGEEGLV